MSHEITDKFYNKFVKIFMKMVINVFFLKEMDLCKKKRISDMSDVKLDAIT